VRTRTRTRGTTGSGNGGEAESGRLASRSDSAANGVMIIEEVGLIDDLWKSHWLSYSSTVRTYLPSMIILVQLSVFAPLRMLSFAETLGKCAYSPHYYDNLTLASRHWWLNAVTVTLGLSRGKYERLCCCSAGMSDVNTLSLSIRHNDHGLPISQQTA
jgi:hypothetical protein